MLLLVVVGGYEWRYVVGDGVGLFGVLLIKLEHCWYICLDKLEMVLVGEVEGNF